jgi:hypothetical protein
VAQRLGARRTSEERGIADHDGAQKHEERRKGQRGRERGSKEGQAGVSKDVQFTGWWVGGWRCRAPPTGFGGSTSSSTTFAHSPCGQHGCFAMTGGNPGPAVARRVRRGQRGLCACDCFVQRVQWSGDDDAMRCDAMLWATGGALYPRVAAAGKQPRAVGEAQDADTQTGQDRTGQARPGPCRLSSNPGILALLHVVCRYSHHSRSWCVRRGAASHGQQSRCGRRLSQRRARRVETFMSVTCRRRGGMQWVQGGL